MLPCCCFGFYFDPCFSGLWQDPPLGSPLWEGCGLLCSPKVRVIPILEHTYPGNLSWCEDFTWRMDEKCLYLHRWLKAALKSELVPLVWALPMEFSWVGAPLAAQAHFAESAWLWWITCRLCSSSPMSLKRKKSPKKQWMKIIPIGQCIYNYPAAFPGLDGCGEQQHCQNRFCFVPLLLFWHHWFCEFLVVFCQAELLTGVGKRGGSSVRISEIWDFIRFRRNRLNEPVHCLCIAWLV